MKVWGLQTPFPLQLLGQSFFFFFLISKEGMMDERRREGARTGVLDDKVDLDVVLARVVEANVIVASHASGIRDLDVGLEVI